jgi:hypothetical protein
MDAVPVRSIHFNRPPCSHGPLAAIVLKGVPPEYFNNEEYKGVDLSNPVEVGAVMKAAQSNVVYYDMEKDIYKLNSRALEVALRSYEPIIKK